MPIQLTNYKAIIFDLDNTLLDRTRSFKHFTRKLVDRYINDLSDAEREEAIAVIIERDEDGYKDKRALFAELSELLPWKEKPQQQELLEFYNQEYAACAVLMDGAAQLLDWCKGRYKVGLITNGQHVIQDAKLNHLQIKSYFDSIIISESAGVKKPHQRIYELCLEQLELAPEDCVFVGDHPINDIDGAAKAGLRTVWMKVNQPWRDEILQQPLLTVQSLRELHTIFQASHRL